MKIILELRLWQAIVAIIVFILIASLSSSMFYLNGYAKGLEDGKGVCCDPSAGEKLSSSSVSPDGSISCFYVKSYGKAKRISTIERRMK